MTAREVGPPCAGRWVTGRCQMDEYVGGMEAWRIQAVPTEISSRLPQRNLPARSGRCIGTAPKTKPPGPPRLEAPCLIAASPACRQLLKVLWTILDDRRVGQWWWYGVWSCAPTTNLIYPWAAGGVAGHTYGRAGLTCRYLSRRVGAPGSGGGGLAAVGIPRYERRQG